MKALLRQRPLMVALAGSNGAGKSTYYLGWLAPTRLKLINADVLARERGLGVYEAAAAAEAMRQAYFAERQSFVFETVFSDPVGDKLAFLRDAAKDGYTVVLIFIGLASAQLSEERVAGRVLQGGHDVPTDKLMARFDRTLANLQAALKVLPHVYVYDNSDLYEPYREIAVYESGQVARLSQPVPGWFAPLMP